MAMSLIGLVLSGTEIPLIRAKNAGPARPGQRIDLIVIHTMEAPEKPGTAHGVAEWFAGPNAPQASAHYCIDAVDVIQCVPEDVVAWAAPGANRRGIHLEHAGYASQTPENWADEYSDRVLSLSAELAADIARRHDIPIVRLTVDQLAAGARGFCGHVDVTNAINGGKGHTDPGVAFPWDNYLTLVGGALAPPMAPAEPVENA